MTRENQERIDRVRRAISTEYENCSKDEALIDVLTDLMHFAERNDLDFSDALHLACWHFVEESRSAK
jgi:hypothetical protein